MLEIEGRKIPCYSLNTLIIGSGAAALNAAIQLYDHGQKNIAIATEGWGRGTSNNTGSDKQTYYKLSLSGDRTDSPLEMARDLFMGGSMHGDIALCEAQNSIRTFFHLVDLGVPFPFDRFGGYVGYKTDFDPRQRATSAGPLTSQLMFEALGQAVRHRQIKVFDGLQVIALITTTSKEDSQVIGALALDNSQKNSSGPNFVTFNAMNVILGTGGPAGMYSASVYPESQLGSSGMAYAIGAIGNNLTESQFGLASTKFRWNLSGSYQQVIPHYFSTDEQGEDEQEFLNVHFPDMERLASAIFLKGYQWPFDPGKVHNFGSSLIDILVYQEMIQKGRRVFLDFTQNPSGGGILQDFAFEHLSPEAYAYLENSQALLKTPIERLRQMNQPAIDLYQENGIDIANEPLEIAVCAQHNNGGLKGNIWWESNIKHLFPVGEANGTHGVYRPGGSALNSGQVGGLRAAQYICQKYMQDPPESKHFLTMAEEQIRAKLAWADKAIEDDPQHKSRWQDLRRQIQERMTKHGAHIRDPHTLPASIEEAWQMWSDLQSQTQVSDVAKLGEAFKNLDLCLTHALYLEAISEYLNRGGLSRGSYLVKDPKGKLPCETLSEEWKFRLNQEDDFVSTHILEIHWDEEEQVHKQWVEIRPIPLAESWFENVWHEFRKNYNID